MPNAEFFQKLGFFALPKFLDEAECARVIDAMSVAGRRDATVGSNTAEFAVDRSYRRTKFVDVDEDVRAEIAARLHDVRRPIEAHYDVSLTDVQRPQFLAYGVGDFYKAHRDDTSSATGALVSKERKISAVVFVNPQTEEPRPGCYVGGALTFFELFDDPVGRRLGFPLEPEPGLLVTFASSMLHAVTPVTHGERYTIVSWFR